MSKKLNDGLFPSYLIIYTNPEVTKAPFFQISWVAIKFNFQFEASWKLIKDQLKTDEIEL